MKSVILAAALVLGFGTAGVAQANEGVELPQQSWPQAGPFGRIDQKQAQRGFQVFKEICANCHALGLVPYRALKGIGFTADQVKEIAAAAQVTDGPNDQGEMFQRPGKPSDRFVKPFANEKAAAAANGGAAPPDLSVIVKARLGAENYIAALLTGYPDEPPAGAQVPEGKYYNKYFPGHAIGMPKMLFDDSVTYADGTKATALQEAKDVATFLSYVSEPTQDERKGLGAKVILFLLVFAGLMYGCKRQLWAGLH
ncbi:MAG: cytochrome c1 [Rhodospirillaceae bacterium]